MVLRASEPSRSAVSSYAGPNIWRKSFAKNWLRRFAANAVTVFTDNLRVILKTEVGHDLRLQGSAPDRLIPVGRSDGRHGSEDGPFCRVRKLPIIQRFAHPDRPSWRWPFTSRSLLSSDRKPEAW